MRAFRVFVVMVLSFVLAAPAFAKSASRTRLVTSPDPAKLGQTVKLAAEVDGVGGGAPTGTASFSDGAVTLGAGTLSPYGAGQATLVASDTHTCALNSTGGVSCWGANTAGKLGDGTTTQRLTPVVVSGLSSGVVAITAGLHHTCALTSAGAVLCWGGNSFGQLGDGTTTSRPSPAAVSGLSSGVVAIAAGYWHSCALTNAGAVKCWGYNAYGQLGDGTTVNRHAPVAVPKLASGVVAIAVAQRHGCALVAAGAVKCWGANDSGQLGDGTTTQRLTPTAVSGLSSGVVAITTGWSHSCALTSARAVTCWGSRSSGYDGVVTNYSTPTAVPGLSSGVVAIAAGYWHDCVLKGEGVLLCWGNNQYSQLGDRTKTNRFTPVSVPGHTRGVAAIAAGSRQTCVSTISGVVRCWGDNLTGQLGDGTTKSRRAPKPVSGLTALVRARAPILVNSLGVGAHTLRATYPSDALHSSSSGSHTQTIVP